MPWLLVLLLAAGREAKAVPGPEPEAQALHEYNWGEADYTGPEYADFAGQNTEIPTFPGEKTFPGPAAFRRSGFPGQNTEMQTFRPVVFRRPESSFPGSAYPESGFPGSGYPESGFPGSGFPGYGFPEYTEYAPQPQSGGLAGPLRKAEMEASFCYPDVAKCLPLIIGALQVS
jgi:hypothetical protein